MTLKMKVLHHNQCFDGACSASLFTRFHRECIGTASEYTYAGLMHKAGAQFSDADFDGDENAIVDFKYSSTPKLTWWFDHHQSAFMTEEDRARFDAQQADGSHSMRHFFDPLYISCTGYIAHIAETKFGFDTSSLKDLIYWANIVDGAKYESAEAVVEMREPAMKLTMVIEAAKDKTLIPRLIPLLTEKSFAEILNESFIAEELASLWQEHLSAIDLIRSRAAMRGDTVYFDLTDQPIEGYSKFIPYYLHPEAVYTVGLTRSSFRTKVSVGTNPWTTLPEEGLVNIAALCEKFGGGGHARVGAMSFTTDESGLTKAREAAAFALTTLEG